MLAPAIATRREGFPVTRGDRRRLGELGGPSWRSSPASRAVFLPDGSAPRKGEIFRNPTSRRNARDDCEPAGATRSTRARSRDTIGGLHEERTAASSRKRDFAAHKSEWVEPVSTNYRGYDVWELPPNRQGIAALQMLNMLEGYDLKAMGFGSLPRHMHLFVEAKKLAFEDRAKFYADPDFAKCRSRN